jgi:hypothetical protein
LNGVPGSQGLPGAAGTNGIDGAVGAAGSQGFNGATGPQGLAGTNGLNGPPGSQGLTGTSGSNGLNGLNGAAGSQGATGSNGTNGVNGAAGSNGVNGSHGLTGATGSQGLTGASGTNGTNGTDGNVGAQGANGIDGIDGAPGSQGLAGATGSNGATGPQGVAGVGIAQTLTISGDTLFITSGNYILIPGLSLINSLIVEGCTDATATNYNASANTDDGSCMFLAIGDTYGGGIIFYLDGNGGGLISASQDQSTGAEWGCSINLISGADGTAIGTGNQNTIDIEAGCTTSGIAADICANLTLGGFSDWFLPSKDELNEMYVRLHTQSLGSFTSYYWSSTENDAQTAFYFDFGTAVNTYVGKNNSLRVRAVRAF